LLPLEIHIPLKVTVSEGIALKVSQDSSIKLTIKEGGGGSLPVYTGDTTVIPKTIEQVLETANKSVLSDINVLGIPYFETSNVKGITAIIGGNG
jgi:hypothetical protein